MTKLVVARCPNCGASLRVEPESRLVACEYCHASVYVDAARTQSGSAAPRRASVVPRLFALFGALLLASTLLAVLWLYQHSGAARPAPSSASPLPPSVPEASVTAAPLEIAESAEATSTRLAPVPAARGTGPAMAEGETVVAGALDATLVRRSIRQHLSRSRMCYEQGLKRTPALSGQVLIRFEVGADGATSHVRSDESSLPDARVVSCIAAAFGGMQFPGPQQGNVSVIYPLELSPH